MVQVVFITDYHVPDDLSGQRVLAVVGSSTALGNWDPNDGPRGIEYPPRSGKLDYAENFYNWRQAGQGIALCTFVLVIN